MKLMQQLQTLMLQGMTTLAKAPLFLVNVLHPQVHAQQNNRLLNWQIGDNVLLTLVSHAPPLWRLLLRFVTAHPVLQNRWT